MQISDGQVGVPDHGFSVLRSTGARAKDIVWDDWNSDSSPIAGGVTIMTEPFTPGCCLPFWRGTQRSLPSCCMVKARQARLRREFSRRLPPFASAGNYSFIAPRGSRHRCCWSRMPVVVEAEPGEQRSPDSAHHLERVAGWNATVATSVADLPLVQERDETPMSNRESRWGGVRR